MSDTPSTGFLEDIALTLFDYLFTKRTPEQLELVIKNIKLAGLPVQSVAITDLVKKYLTDETVASEMATWAVKEVLQKIAVDAMEPYGGVASGRISGPANVESLDRYSGPDLRRVETLDRPPSSVYRRFREDDIINESVKVLSIERQVAEYIMGGHDDGEILYEGSGREEAGESGFDVGGEG